jgi:hypothetical protein
MMGKFLKEEKDRYVQCKANSQYLPDTARAIGNYKGKARPYCLPEDQAEFNLFVEIREDVQAYFHEFEIKWHDGKNRNPSNHLCDSQVCCVNFLYSFSRHPSALRKLLMPLFPNIKSMIPLECDDMYVAHEWIGRENYLGEKIPRHGKRTRGANFTSADAAVMFNRNDGSIQFVLIEWKYTETYSIVNRKFAPSGTDRTTIYRHLFDRDDFPLKKELLPDFDALFFEPFYQLMRQQLLANEMEKAKELGADVVSLLHIAPARNHQLSRVTSPELMHLGESVIGVWQRLVKKPSRFQSIYCENLFGAFKIGEHPEMLPWWEYTTERYPWFIQTSGEF